MQGRHQRELARTGERRLLEPLDRRPHALRANVKVGLLLEHVLQERLHRRAHARATLGARNVGAGAGEVALEPVEALQQLGRLGVSRQPFQGRLALGDECRGEGAVAVQAGAAGARAPEVGSQLERDLRACLHLGAQMAARGLHVVGEGVLQLPGAHRASLRPLPTRSFSAHPGLQRGPGRPGAAPAAARRSR